MLFALFTYSQFSFQKDASDQTTEVPQQSDSHKHKPYVDSKPLYNKTCACHPDSAAREGLGEAVEGSGRHVAIRDTDNHNP